MVITFLNMKAFQVQSNLFFFIIIFSKVESPLLRDARKGDLQSKLTASERITFPFHRNRKLYVSLVTLLE